MNTYSIYLTRKFSIEHALHWDIFDNKIDIYMLYTDTNAKIIYSGNELFLRPSYKRGQLVAKKKKGFSILLIYTYSIIDIFQGNNSTWFCLIWWLRMWHKNINDPKMKTYQVNNWPHFGLWIPSQEHCASQEYGIHLMDQWV